MAEQLIDYAPGDLDPVHSRPGVCAFACAALSVGGVALTMFLIALPISGPAGGRLREIAPLFAIGVGLLWLAGVILGIVALRQRHRILTFARAALAICAAMIVLFGLMILLMY